MYYQTKKRLDGLIAIAKNDEALGKKALAELEAAEAARRGGLLVQGRSCGEVFTGVRVGVHRCLLVVRGTVQIATTLASGRCVNFWGLETSYT